MPLIDDPASTQPPRRLSTLPSWLASQLAREADRVVTAELAAEGFRKQHFAVLASLAEQGAISQAALGRRLWIDRSDLHALLDELERDGLVERRRDQADRRRNLVDLSRSGAAALERMDARVQAAQRSLLSHLSAGERRDLVRLLSKAVGA
jgi:DNA-binding MarR family transcriptional regulator